MRCPTLTLRSDRKIIGRVLKSQETFKVTVLAWKNLLLGLWSLDAPVCSSFEGVELVQVHDVDALVSYWILPAVV